MNKIIYLFSKLSQNKTFLSFLIRKIFKDCNYLSLKHLIDLNAASRPWYAYCAYNSALQAKKLGYKKISFIEFGVAEGNGILYLEKISDKIAKELNIEIEIYGFDTGEGLIKPKDYKDLPYFFKEGMYQMNFKKLKLKLKRAKLILGDVEKTIQNFFENYNPATIAAIFNDLDFYSSTLNSFKIFDFDIENFLPRVFCYFDDVVGSAEEMYSEFTGELLAINQFNKFHENSKICINRNLLHLDLSWKNQIYYLHNFNHSKYTNFIYADEQKEIKKSIELK